MVLSNGASDGERQARTHVDSGGTAELKIVPKMYPSSGNGAFFALLATNEINNLCVLNTPQKFDPD